MEIDGAIVPNSERATMTSNMHVLLGCSPICDLQPVHDALLYLAWRVALPFSWQNCLPHVIMTCSSCEQTAPTYASSQMHFSFRRCRPQVTYYMEARYTVEGQACQASATMPHGAGAYNRSPTLPLRTSLPWDGHLSLSCFNSASFRWISN